MDRDGYLDMNEWKNFYDIFIDDFQKNCNIYGDWYIDSTDISSCMYTASWLK